MANEFAVGGGVFDERRYAARYFKGLGIEIGPGYLPIPVDPKVCTVKYVDRLTEREMRVVFPELAPAELVRSDMLCDVARTGLCCRTASLDFVIASHLLEHCPNPLRLIAEFHRVLRPFGVLYLALPDKTRTFDGPRASTPLSRLIESLDADVTEPDESQLIDYLVHAAKTPIPEQADDRRRLFERELARSFHIHVWTSEEAIEFVRYMIVERGLGFELLELYLPKGVKNEVAFVLEKRPSTPPEAAQRFDSSLAILTQRESAMTIAIRDMAAHAEAIGRLRQVGPSPALTPYRKLQDALLPPDTARRRFFAAAKRGVGRVARRLRP